ncbi:hypothetical protein LTR94_031512, partial [Friedmanniomyces endolithicus]
TMGIGALSHRRRSRRGGAGPAGVAGTRRRPCRLGQQRRAEGRRHHRRHRRADRAAPRRCESGHVGRFGAKGRCRLGLSGAGDGRRPGDDGQADAGPAHRRADGHPAAGHQERAARALVSRSRAAAAHHDHLDLRPDPARRCRHPLPRRREPQSVEDQPQHADRSDLDPVAGAHPGGHRRAVDPPSRRA